MNEIQRIFRNDENRWKRGRLGLYQMCDKTVENVLVVCLDILKIGFSPHRSTWMTILAFTFSRSLNQLNNTKQQSNDTHRKQTNPSLPNFSHTFRLRKLSNFTLCLVYRDRQSDFGSAWALCPHILLDSNRSFFSVRLLGLFFFFLAFSFADSWENKHIQFVNVVMRLHLLLLHHILERSDSWIFFYCWILKI